MGGAGKTLTLDEIIAINYRQIERFGGLYLEGNDNLLNPGTLESVLAACQGPLFGVDRYPTVVDKAAAIAWFIITGHVFHDGNKRTGLLACYTLLALNGYQLPIDRAARDIALQVADGQVSLEDFTAWIEARVELLAE